MVPPQVNLPIAMWPSSLAMVERHTASKRTGRDISHAPYSNMASFEESRSVIVRELGSIAISRFTCGGTIKTPSPVHLAYVDKTGQWSKVFSWSQGD